MDAKIIFQLALQSEIHFERVSKLLDNAVVTIVLLIFVMKEGTHTLSNTNNMHLLLKIFFFYKMLSYKL